MAFGYKVHHEVLLLCAPHRKDNKAVVSVHPWEISETSPPQGKGQGKYFGALLELSRKME